MTTAKKTPTTDALLVELRTLRAGMERDYGAMLDYRDTPGSWTQRQKDAYEERRARFPQHLSWCKRVTEEIEKAVALLAWCVPARDRLRAAKASIEQQIKDAPDSSEIADARARTAEWARQNGLAAALTAIRRGVDYINGHPALPNPLSQLLTDTCASCGHVEVKWQGPLDPLEEQVEKAEALIATGPASLAALRASVATYLSAVEAANVLS